jgi:hypothetical protein
MTVPDPKGHDDGINRFYLVLMVGDSTHILSDRGDNYTLSDVTSLVDLVYLFLILLSDMRSKILTYAQPSG